MKSLLRMTSYVKPYQWVVVFLIITLIIPVAMELFVPRALKYVIDEGIDKGSMSAIVSGSLVMLTTALLGAIATLGQGIFRARLSQGLAFDLRNDLFAHIQSLSFQNLDYMGTGQLMTRLSSDVDLVRMFVSNGLALLLRALLMIFGSLVMMLIINWQLALVMLVLLPLAGLIIWSVMHFAQPLFLIVQQRLEKLNTIVQENLAGVQVVKAFVREPYEIGRFNLINSQYQNESIRVGRLLAVALPIITILTNLGLVAVVTFGGRSVINERLTLGELVAFNSYLMISMAPLLLLGNILTLVSRAEASAERVWEVFDTIPSIVAIPNAYRNLSGLGQIIFEDVAFRYDGTGQLLSHPEREDFQGGRKILDQINLTIEKGQKVALLGATGSGKSTLVNLIPRFYDPITGIIKIDETDIRDWDPGVLRSHLGVVLQETTLFSGTIRENIAYGKPEATMDEVVKAAKLAQAHEFITRFENGYESWVEERGANLSGGQKQRIAIARALLTSPSVLIFDDSTSSVDMETEVKIHRALEELSNQQTIIIIAQRISSVINADKIFILDQGQISASGTHQELMSASPIYREIFISQLGDNFSELGIAGD